MAHRSRGFRDEARGSCVPGWRAEDRAHPSSESRQPGSKSRLAGPCYARTAATGDLELTERGQRRLVGRLPFFVGGDGEIEIAEQAILQTVDPAVDCEVLPAFPRVARDTCRAHIRGLLDHVQFAQTRCT